MNKRKQIFTLIVGGQDSGKSTFSHNIIVPYSLRKPVLNVLPDDNEELFERYPEVELEELHLLTDPGIFNVFVESPKDYALIKWDKKNRTGFRHGMVNIDDGRSILGSRDDQFRKFQGRRRQANIDILFNIHGLSETPPSSSTWLTDIVLFGTSDEYDRWTIDHAQKFRPIVDRINKISATKNPYYYEHYKMKRGFLFHPVTGKLIA